MEGRVPRVPDQIPIPSSRRLFGTRGARPSIGMEGRPPGVPDRIPIPITKEIWDSRSSSLQDRHSPMNILERDPGRRSLPHHPPIERDNQSILIYVTVNVKAAAVYWLARMPSKRFWTRGRKVTTGWWAVMPSCPITSISSAHRWFAPPRSSSGCSSGNRQPPVTGRAKMRNRSGRRISSIVKCVAVKATVRNGITYGRIRWWRGSVPVRKTGHGREN